MEKRDEDELIGRYSELFRQSAQNPVGVPYWGVQCDVGWYPLIDRLCSKIQGRINNLKSPEVTIIQIKEKDGSLRVSYHGGDDYIAGLIDMAQELSSCICEVCGCSGAKKKLLLGWIKTLCESCEKKLNEGI
ncbi:hypothetical protein ICJ54_24955 [Pseudomonas asiatica]|uniref:hypothetical protein n=1 Tax=Pseudomonas TaxID=286 RepID=UPI00156DE483|nr:MULTISPECIES: hypothetical protein [Pseudomonas]MDD2077021.1 hypothetical protein [Pseudomonas putida]QKL04061.1 hypothetical protein GEV39_23030 [Pseudomonas sp. NY5710]QNT40642.1 hypothetical protein ICJ54_24955 [Pseudomonas asiatica]HDS1693556.1 hypothetical protein [Pseudomonas putida]